MLRGYALAGPLQALSNEAVEHQFATNVFGLLKITRAFLPRMRERRSGRVINVSSVVGRVAFPGLGVYSATKFAVEALSDALRMELAGFGVSVVVIEPNFVATNLGIPSHDQAARFPAATSGYEQLTAISKSYLDRQLANGIPAEIVGRRIAAVATARRPKAR
jgi:short-subunit dehydrogenase